MQFAELLEVVADVRQLLELGADAGLLTLDNVMRVLR